MVAVLIDHGRHGHIDPYGPSRRTGRAAVPRRRTPTLVPNSSPTRAAADGPARVAARWQPAAGREGTAPVGRLATRPAAPAPAGTSLLSAVSRPTPAAYRRRRILALGVTLLLGVAGWLAVQGAARAVAGGAPAGGSSSRPVPAAARVWVVRPGDTLWRIAVSDTRGDPRPVVDRLDAELGGRPLQVGQRIPLPAGD